MTFEEFFAKKKIDLKALKAADEPLFEEFKAHYSAMGEKSFDHSKKFWFNKLRKNFHLVEEEPIVTKTPDKQDTAPASVKTASPTIKATGFKPRFKVSGTSENATRKPELPQQAATEPSKPAGFKPRFKAAVTKTDNAETAKQEKPEENTVNASPENTAENKEKSALETPASKPTGFKPRFKAGVTKTDNAETAKQEKPVESTVNDGPENTTENKEKPALETPASKPTGFKPRFKAGVTKIDKKEE